MDDFGFIIVRHVNSTLTNQYWIHNYQSIRKLYPQEPILIVDDNSDKKYLSTHHLTLSRCTIVQSEYPLAGEILGYYYFYKTRLFRQAVVLHDSVFLHYPLPKVHEPVRFLWSFRPDFEEKGHVSTIVSRFEEKNRLQKMYEKSHWKGCFGIQAIIQLSFVDRLVERHDIFTKILPFVKTRRERQALERVFALLCYQERPHIQSVFGSILRYPLQWGTTFEEYKSNRHAFAHLPAMKVWTGR